jgi:hypothetical protein
MAAGSPDSATPLYAFEQAGGRAGSHRDLRAARAELAVLWARLDGDPERDLPALEKHDPDGWQFLLRYVTDGPLCIGWYEAKRPELEAKQTRYNALVMVVAFVLFTLAFLLPFQPLILFFLQSQLDVSGTGSTTGLVDVAALLGVVGTGTTVALRLSSRGIRYQRQAAVFHKASAALKEQLYRLEIEWRGKPLVERPDDGSTRMTAAFDEAVRRAVGQAQAVLADERDQYFETLIVDVKALTEEVAAATDGLASRAAFRSDRRHEDAQRRGALETQVADAQLARDTAAAKIAMLEQEVAAADERMKEGLQALLLEQRLLFAEKEQQLRLLQGLRRSLG